MAKILVIVDIGGKETRRCSMKILIVDDDKLIAGSTSQILEIAGYEVLTANNGKTGITKAMMVLPDLILMDINMPGMDGREATRTLRNQGYTGRIAAYTSSVEHKEILQAGCDFIISKPPESMDIFLHAIKQSQAY